jgi:hypothetical protein
VAEDGAGVRGEVGEVVGEVGRQVGDGGALVGVGDDPAAHAPEPLDAVGVGVVGGGVDQANLVGVLGQERAQHERSGGGVDAQVVVQDDRRAPPRARAREERGQLVDQRLRPAAGGGQAVEEAVAPVQRAEAGHLGVLARGLDQPLAAPAPGRPHPGQRRVQGGLDLVLQVQVGPGERGQQARQVGRDVDQGREVGEQVGDGWRGGRCHR